MHNRTLRNILAISCAIIVGLVPISSTSTLLCIITAAHSSSCRGDLIQKVPHGGSSRRRSRAITTPRMGQSFNLQAVASMGRVMRHPALAVPHLSVPHIGHLDFEALKDTGCKGIVFDKDNTLTAPYADEPHPLVEEGLQRCMEIFEGRVCILSNSAGTRDDPGYEDAIRIETALGIPVVRHDDKKPGGIKDVLEFFDGKGTDGEKVQLDELCFVGDRLLTDVVFGNLHGMLAVHTQPLLLKGDNRAAAVFRYLERKVFLDLLYKRWHVQPQPHRLCPGGATMLDRRRIDVNIGVGGG